MKALSDGSPTDRIQARAPVLWLLVPAAAGISLAGAIPLDRPLYPALGGLVLAAAALFLAGRALAVSRQAAKAVLLCGAFLLGFSYGSARLPDRLKWLAPLPRREVTVTIRVEKTFPQDRWGRSRGIARIEEAPQIQNYLEGGFVLYRLNEAAPAPSRAERLRVKGLIRRIDPEKAGDNPASFDAWLERKGVYLELARGHVTEIVAPPPPVERIGAQFRRWAAARLREGSERNPEDRAMVPAMLLGEKNLLSPGDKADFRQTGMMHLFAVSGLHVGLVALTLESLLALLRVPRRARIFSSLLGLLAYVLMIGSPASAVRAFIMIAFHRAGALMGRPAPGIPALSASALAVLIWNPAQLFDTGAQLSYGIVAGILLYGLPMGKMLVARMPLYEDLPPQDLKRLQRGMLHARDWLCEGAGAALGAFLISTPLSIQYFGIFAPGSMLLTLLMTPLALVCVASALLALGMAALVLLPPLAMLGQAGIFLNHAAWLCTWEMQAVTRCAARIPLISGNVSFPAPWAGTLVAAAMLALMLLLHSERTQKTLFWQLCPLGSLLAVVAMCAA